MRRLKKYLGHITRLTGKRGHECLKCKRRECLQQHGDQLDESKQLFLQGRSHRFLKQLNIPFQIEKDKSSLRAYWLTGILACELTSFLDF